VNVLNLFKFIFHQNISCRPNEIIKTQFFPLYKKALDGELHEKFAFFMNSKIHALYNKTNRNSLPKMQNEGIEKMSSLYMTSNNMLVLQLNDILSRLIPAGIVQIMYSYSDWFLNRPVDDEIVDPRRILSLSDLEYGFSLWLFTCFVAILCFVCELSIQMFKN
jgi:hypothetical protein